MTDKQPEALRVADELDRPYWDDGTPHGQHVKAAKVIRTQHAEIKRLSDALKWEQNRAESVVTHGPRCEKWGPAHYECALRAIERKDALLQQAVNMFSQCIRYDFDDEPLDEFDAHAKDLCDAITKELQ